MISCQCLVCNTPFIIRGNTLPPERTGKYCSHKCRAAHKTRNVRKRFWEKVAILSPQACWPWLAATDEYGYGRFTVAVGKTVLAHRFAYEDTAGFLLPRFCACHHCDNPPCCNPDHLFPGTRLENNHDAMKKGRVSHGTRHWNARLTEETVNEILSLDGIMPDAVISERFHISERYVRRIHAHEAWKHLRR